MFAKINYRLAIGFLFLIPACVFNSEISADDACATVTADLSPGDNTPTPQECEEAAEWINLMTKAGEEYEKEEALRKEKLEQLLKTMPEIDPSGNTIYKIEDIANENELLNYDDFKRRYYPHYDDSRLDPSIEISIEGGIVNRVYESSMVDSFSTYSEYKPLIQVKDVNDNITISCFTESVDQLSGINLDDILTIRGLITGGGFGSEDLILNPCIPVKNGINTVIPTMTPIPPAAEVSQVATGVIEASEMIFEFDSNAVGASIKYRNKDISVKGVISDIGTDIWTDKTYVSVGAVSIFDIYEIRCIVNNPSEVASLDKGSPITISGTFYMNMMDMYIDIMPCSVVTN